MSQPRDNDNPEIDTGDDAFLEQDMGLAARGIALVKMEGRVFLRFSGEVRYEGLRVPYRLVPARGVLAKPSKWRKMDMLARRELIEERTSDKAIAELQVDTEEFVREIADELLWRERQFMFEPKGFCKWGAKPNITEFNK